MSASQYLWDAWILGWNLCKLPGNLWIVFLCVIQNVAESFQSSPLSLSTHSELRNLKKISALWVCSVCWHSPLLQLHLLRTSEVVPQLEVKITVHPYSWFKRVKKWFKRVKKVNALSFKLLLGRFVWGIFGIFCWSWLSLGMAETPSLAFRIQLDKAMSYLICCWPWYHFE